MSLLPQTDATTRVLAMLPAQVRARDAASGGLLTAMVEAVAGELDILERDIDALYASWFIETCAEWVVPYLADLVGVTDLPPDLPGVTSRRAFAANTVRYRQAKGTLGAVEQVARAAPPFPPPQADPGIEHLATEAAMPLPLGPRRLLALLTAARASAPALTGTDDDGALPLGVQVDGGDLGPERIRVCGLEDLAQT